MAAAFGLPEGTTVEDQFGSAYGKLTLLLEHSACIT